MHMISKFLTFDNNTRRGGTYYVNYYNLRLWLEARFPGYSFMVNTDITDNAIAVNISKALPADDIGNKEIHVACTKIPFVFIIDNDEYRIKQIIQDAINRKEYLDNDSITNKYINKSMTKGGFRMGDKFGLVTEQGYPMPGSYGYKPLNEEDNRKILEENAKKESDKEKENKDK